MSENPRPTLLTRILELASLAVVPAAVFCWLAVFEVEGFYPDLFSHFQLQYFLIGFVGTIVFFLADWKIILTLSFLTMVGSLYLLSPYLSYSKTSSASETSLKIATYNIHTSNNKYSEFRALIRKEQPEFFAAIEVDKTWTEELQKLNDLYPHRHEIPRSDNFGISVFSKHPFTIVTTLLEDPSLPPIIVARIKHNNKTAIVYSLHPLPPVRPNAYKIRNQLLTEIAKIVGQSDENAIVIGDLNNTMWSPSFRKFMRTSGLKDSRKSIGIIPTWPQSNPAFFIPIEHILVSKEMTVSSLKAVPIPGSDHKGLVAEIDF